MMRLYRIPFSTNVERVALALAHKGLEAEPVDVDPADRSPIVAASGQSLVPVLEDEGRVVSDSTHILEYLGGALSRSALVPAGPGPPGGVRRLRGLVQPGVEGAAERNCGRPRRAQPGPDADRRARS